MAESVHHAILERVRNEIRELNLSPIEQQNILVLGLPTDREKWVSGYPAIMISPQGAEVISKLSGTAAKDDIEYPVFIGIIDVANQESTNLERWLEWREKVIDRLIHNRLTGITLPTGSSLITVDVEPGPILDPGSWLTHNLMVSIVTMRVTVRKQRRL